MATDVVDQYTAVGFCDLSQEIAERFLSAQLMKFFSLAYVSASRLVLVAKSGSLYIYTRDPLQFLVLIPSKVGPIERIIVSPTSNYIVLTNSKAELFLQDISNVDRDLLGKGPPEMKYMGKAKASVTCFYWADDDQLFFGDRSGTVSVVNVRGNLLHIVIHPILMLDSEVVQIDGFDLLLIVSTRTGCILCNSDREEFKQVGNRPRDGAFGACFMNKSIDEYLRGQVICARPGARFWQVDYGGTVKQTIQFKEALARPPCRPTSTENKRKETEEVVAVGHQDKKYSSQNVTYSELMELKVGEEHFLVTYTKSGIYLFDPQHSKLILWTDHFRNIRGVFVVDTWIYCVSENGDHAGGVSVGRFQVRHKIDLFQSLICGPPGADTQEAIKRFIVDNRRFLKAKSIVINESLRSQMELTKEFLIREQEYECLEIISNIGYSADVLINSQNRSNNTRDGKETVTVLAAKRETATTRTMIASALRNTFNLFSQAGLGRGVSGAVHHSDLIRANGGDLSLRTTTAGVPNQTQRRLELFREITANFSCNNNNGGSNGEDVIVDKKKFFGNRKFKKLSELLKSNEGHEDEAVKESKLLQKLFLIYKSSRMGNVTMVDRYAPMLDKLTLSEVLGLLRKLELLMQDDNGYTEAEAKQNSSVMLFDYLNANVINDAMENVTLEELIDRFVLVNQTKVKAKSCEWCDFPLEILDECLYYDFGRTLFEFLYARQDVANYQKLLKNIPHLLHIYCKYYCGEAAAGVKRDSFLQLLFILRKFSVGNRLSGADWSFLLDLMNELVTNSIVKCFNCSKWNGIRLGVELPAEYSWNYMLNQAARFMNGPALLKEVLKHANSINNGGVSKGFFLKCMQTA